MKISNFDVFGMSCSACQSHIEKAVKKLDGIFKVEINLLTNSMVVEFDENKISENDICGAVESAGYGAEVVRDKFENNEIKISSDENENRKKSKDSKLKNLIISFLFLICLMYFSMGNMMWGFKTFDVFDHKKNPMGFALIQFVLLLPILYIYRDYFFKGFKNLFNGQPNMDSLIAIGSSISTLYGVFALFMMSFAESKLAGNSFGEICDVEYYKNILETYHNCLYFESAGMILTLVSLGKYLEDLSKRKTTKAISNLVNLSPKTAIVFRNGKEIEILAKDVLVGDVVIIKKGFVVPVDGKIIEGTASINESNITGESIPVQKNIGDEVFSSTVVESGFMKIKAMKVGNDTTFETIVKLVKEASNSKAPISKLADKISAIFVPVILTIALATFIVNLCVSHSFELSLNFAITVVVIACPCALGLATPVAVMVGSGKGAECGLLIKNAEIMENAHLIKTIVFDKTGTITEGNPKVIDFVNLTTNNIPEKRICDEEILSVANSIELKSEHPLARAITKFAETKNITTKNIDEFKSVDGLGLFSKIDSDEYFIGNMSISKERTIDTSAIVGFVEEFSKNAKLPLILMKNNEIIAIFSIKDEIRENSIDAISRLKQIKIKTIMLTGDNKKTAECVAEQVGVDEVISQVKPDEKQEVIKNLKLKSKNLVAMVGDGVNDAPALATADIGISIGAGSDVAIETSDIVLLKNDIFDVVNVLKLSKTILSKIKFGLFWAFFYNLICVIIATGVFYYPFGLKINPMIGALAMSLSSVSVVLNALTINLFKKEKPILKNVTTQANVETNLFDCKTSGVCYLDKVKTENINKNDSKKTQNDDIIIENCDKYNEISEKFNVELKIKKEEFMEFFVKDMMCQKCVNHITKTLEDLGVAEIQIDLENKKVKIQTEISKEEVFDAISKAGYNPTED